MIPRMIRRPLGFLCLLGSLALAQQTRTPPRYQEARLEGRVLSDRDGQPLPRARVVLRPVEAGLTTIGVEGDENGNFAIWHIAPGRYTLLAQRDGYLTSSTCLRGGLRMAPVLSIRSADDITELTFRLRPWAVVAGRIRFENGEPAVFVRIDAYREFRDKGRHTYKVAASARTNDRGEYRMYGLQAGPYLVAAVYERTAQNSGYQEQPRVDAEGRELPVTGYATTFYPNTVKLSEAVPVRLDYGQEVGGVDLFLRLVRKVKVLGRVTSGVSGSIVSNASIFLERTDANNTGTLPAPARAEFLRDGSFQIKDVTPGSYVMRAEGNEAGKRLLGRAVLTISDQDVDNVDLIITGESLWAGRFRIDGEGRIQRPAALRVTLEPRSDRGTVVTPTVNNGLSFAARVMTNETYDLYVQNLPDDFYVSSVLLNGSDVLARGIDGSLAAPDRPFDVVLDSRGGRVTARVFGPDGSVWSGANVMLAPDPPRGRLQAYRGVSADEYGQFQIRGIVPGNYILVAWLDDPPCDFYDPDAMDACRAVGMPLTFGQGSEQSFEFAMKAPPKQ
jgi:hypothetical protein